MKDNVIENDEIIYLSMLCSKLIVFIYNFCVNIFKKIIAFKIF